MIVVDVNVVAYLLIRGDKSPLARAVLSRDAHWQLPGMWRHEFVNVLTTYVRAGRLTQDRAQRILESAEGLFSGVTVTMTPRRVLETACRHGISGYDAEYVALAETLAVRCVTEDSQLRKKVSRITVSMEEFCR